MRIDKSNDKLVFHKPGVDKVTFEKEIKEIKEKIEDLDQGGGSSDGTPVNEVEISDTEPTDENVLIWINTSKDMEDFIGGGEIGEEYIKQLEELDKQVDENTENISKMLELVDEPPIYINPTVNLLTSVANIRHNETTNITLTSSFTQNDAGAFVEYTLKRGSITLYEGISLEGFTDVVTLTHGSSVTYTATASYGDGVIKNTALGVEYPSTSIKAGSVSTTKTIKAYAPTYYGIIENADNIDGLTSIVSTSKNNTLTFSLNSQHAVYMYPKSFGNLTSIKDTNGFEYINSYTLITTIQDGVEYNVYTLTDAVTISEFKQIYS